MSAAEYVHTMSTNAYIGSILLSASVSWILSGLTYVFLSVDGNRKLAKAAWVITFFIAFIPFSALAVTSEVSDIREDVELHNRYEAVVKLLPEEQQKLAREAGDSFCALTDKRMDSKKCEKVIIELSDTQVDRN